MPARRRAVSSSVTAVDRAEQTGGPRQGRGSGACRGAEEAEKCRAAVAHQRCWPARCVQPWPRHSVRSEWTAFAGSFRSGGAAASLAELQLQQQVSASSDTVRSPARQSYRAALLDLSSPESSAPLAHRWSGRCAQQSCLSAPLAVVVSRRIGLRVVAAATTMAAAFLSTLFHPRRHTSVGSRVPQASGRQYNLLSL
jgi:hypothetical protein